MINCQNGQNGYKSNDWCRICKGSFCCQNNGCSYSPEDFEDLSYNYLWMKLSEGKISIDHAFVLDQELGAFTQKKCFFELSLEKLKKKQGLLYLRARNIGMPIVDMIHYTREPRKCVNWSESQGCCLKFKDRPKEGRFVEPKPFFDCVAHITPAEVAEEWSRAGMQETLFHLATEFSQK